MATLGCSCAASSLKRLSFERAGITQTQSGRLNLGYMFRHHFAVSSPHHIFSSGAEIPGPSPLSLPRAEPRPRGVGSSSPRSAKSVRWKDGRMGGFEILSGLSKGRGCDWILQKSFPLIRGVELNRGVVRGSNRGLFQRHFTGVRTGSNFQKHGLLEGVVSSPQATRVHVPVVNPGSTHFKP